jgi:hypothetical protein
MNNPALVILGILALAAVYVLFPWVAHIFDCYRRPRLVRCPEAGTKAWVEIDARHAALTAAFGAPRVRPRECSLWEQRGPCAMGCLYLPQARTS